MGYAVTCSKHDVRWRGERDRRLERGGVGSPFHLQSLFLPTCTLRCTYCTFRKAGRTGWSSEFQSRPAPSISSFPQPPLRPPGGQLSASLAVSGRAWGGAAFHLTAACIGQAILTAHLMAAPGASWSRPHWAGLFNSRAKACWNLLCFLILAAVPRCRPKTGFS